MLEAELPEDLALGLCLARLNVSFVNGVDADRKLLFSPIRLDKLLTRKEDQVGKRREKM